ncbi:hypothetical protein LMG28614_05638 [Paraburkholderia ultramafica]|uniref:Uncharacterized protein n=1 Tax=Paraburkholderia ultramafica TaxID=1544867 RepID=A0A6S7BJL0_9BURK|nr:2OG-Fe dioxygenase family protein [Paraburkholderia ultramafica]CAB3802549.1 hypothetical protein LMG28614_05638 [Paraburkholderia ultramafica]
MATTPQKSVSHELAHEDTAVVMPLHPTLTVDPGGMAQQLARNVEVFGAALTDTGHYDRHLVDRELSSVQKAYDNIPSDPNAHDKRRWFTSLSRSCRGELTPLPHFSFSQAVNTENPGPRDIKQMPDDLRLNPLVEAMTRYTVRVAEYFVPELFDDAVRVDLHAIRYQVHGAFLALSTPPFAHRDSEEVVHVILIDRKNVIGGLNYVGVGSRQCNIGFEMNEPLRGFMISNTTLHGVSPLLSADGGAGYRDILVVTVQKLADGALGRKYDQAN